MSHTCKCISSWELASFSCSKHAVCIMWNAFFSLIIHLTNRGLWEVFIYITMMIMLDYSDSLNVPVTVMMIALWWKALFTSEYCVNICTGIWLDIRTTVKKTITVHYITYFYFHQQENETIGGYSITASTINALYSLKKLGKGVSLKGNIKKQNSKVWVTLPNHKRPLTLKLW